MKSRVFLAIWTGLLLAGSLPAATTVFTGPVDELWSNVDNWSAGLPTSADKFRINADLCVLDIPGQVGQNGVWEGGNAGYLRLVDGAEVTVGQWSIIAYNGGAEDARHTLEILGGVYNGGSPDRPNDGRVFVGREGFAQLIIDYSGVMNVLHQELGVGVGTNGDGLVFLNGGTLNLSDNGDWPLRFATGSGAKGHMDIAGGVMKQRFSAGRLTRINDYIADGTITAYDGVGTVVIDTGDANDFIHVRGLHPLDPAPMDGDNIVPGSVTLEWTVDAGTAVDVWIGTQADLSDFTQIVDKQVVTSVQTNTVKGTRYFWAVDTYPAGAEDPSFGPIFDFNVDNQAPIVDAGDDVTTWLTDGTVEVTLTGSVVDDDATTTLWTVVSQPDDPNSPAAVIADPAALDTTVTLSALGEYVLQLEADDGEYQGMDTLTINVFSDHCEAAKSLPGWVAIPGDINLDCVVNELDEAIMLENWLNCNGLDCP